jgi:hypothetical protein
MSSDFIIVSDRPEPAPEDTSPAARAQKWFPAVRGISAETVERLRGQVERNLETGAFLHLLPKMPAQHLRAAELKTCVEQVIAEQWDSLTPEERLLTRFPTVQAVGDRVEIPNRGAGVVIHRELTRRFSIEMAFLMQDGSIFKREFID